MFDEPMDGRMGLYAVNDGNSERAFTYRVTELASGKTVSSGVYTAAPDSSAPIAFVPVAEGEKRFYFIEWQCGDEKGCNHFMTNIKDIDYSEYIAYIEKCGYDVWSGFGG